MHPVNNGTPLTPAALPKSPNALLGNGVNGGRVNSPIPGSVVDEGVQYAEKEAVMRANNYEPQLNGGEYKKRKYY